MPIRPEMKGRYPKDWNAITARIRERAGNVCECTGQCGSDHGGRCEAPNGKVVLRDQRAPERWRLHTCKGVCLGEGCPARSVLIVLTVAHLNHIPEDVRDENLLALCQRCHLRLDAPEHRKNAAATRARKADGRTGQRSLFAASST